MPAAGPVCPACWNRIRRLSPPLCRACGDPLPSWRIISDALTRCPRCRRRPPAVAIARAAGEYEGSLRGIIHAFKYEGRRGLAGPLGQLAASEGKDVLRGADCVVPVPLHPVRRLQRGFNQAEDLARELRLPVANVLWRLRMTSPQTGLHAWARRRNVRGAFAFSPLWSRWHRRSALAGSVVVLVDDVRTTGATLNECGEVLLDAGVREVRALTVARAARPHKRADTAA
jgi:ComF family protein